MTTDNTNTTRNDSLAARTDTWLQSSLFWSPGHGDIMRKVDRCARVLEQVTMKLLLLQYVRLPDAIRNAPRYSAGMGGG
ncbi:hypothetical protein J4V46_25375, partial [Escherichia coli]